MKRVILSLVAFSLFSFGTGFAAILPDKALVVIPIQGDIEPAMTAFVRRNVSKALEDGADLLIFDIDTFGGRVDSALQISSFIGSVQDAETIAFIRSGPEGMGVSWSAGALIAMSCSAIYMAPGTSIGAAAPVILSPDGKSEAAGEKAVSAVRAQMAALAEKNGYPVEIALAMVDWDMELYEVEDGGAFRLMSASEIESREKSAPGTVVKGKLVSAKGKLLSLTAGEAERYGLSKGTAADFAALGKILDAGGPVIEMKKGLADAIVSFLTSGPVQGILILIGLVALFMEISSPGFGIPGTVAVICFLAIFGGNSLLGTVGSLELILFLAGVGLFAVEIFVLPGFGITGISGLVLIGLSLILSMQDFIIPDVPWKWDLFYRNLLIVASGLIAGLAGVGVLILTAPKLRMFDRLTLKTFIRGTAGGPETSGKEEEAFEEVPASMAGKRGLAVSILRPSGKAEFGGVVYSVEAEGEFVAQGTRVEVVRVRGNRIIVKPVGTKGSKDTQGSAATGG